MHFLLGHNFDLNKMCFFLCGIWELDDGVTISLNAKAESIIMFGTRVSGREREISLYSKSI